MTPKGSSSATQATTEHISWYVLVAALIWVPSWPQPYKHILKMSLISDQIYGSCESQGRGWNNDQHHYCHPAQVHPAISDCLLWHFEEK